jgi:hypothetical protein
VPPVFLVRPAGRTHLEVAAGPPLRVVPKAAVRFKVLDTKSLRGLCYLNDTIDYHGQVPIRTIATRTPYPVEIIQTHGPG